MKHVPRVIAAHGMGAALHVNNACGHTFAGAVTGAPPETHSSEGGGVWAEYLPKAALTSNGLFLDDANVLVPVWLGGRGDRPAFPIGRNRIFFYVVKSPWYGTVRTFWSYVQRSLAKAQDLHTLS